jgi:hypothetical protein
MPRLSHSADVPLCACGALGYSKAMTMLRKSRFILCLAAALAGGQAHAVDLFERHGRAPAGDRVFICHGYSCRIVTPVSLSAVEIGRILAPLQETLADAEAERQALSRSIAAFEQVVGLRVGTSGDLPAMQFGGGRDDQMDCIDEATNTTSLLLFLDERGALTHHKVLPPTARGFFFDGRYPHATAVVADKASGQKWSVDSWPRGNGEAPVIMPLRDWSRQRTSALPS